MSEEKKYFESIFFRDQRSDQREGERYSKLPMHENEKLFVFAIAEITAEGFALSLVSFFTGRN
jgi:hypothetical protein